MTLMAVDTMKSGHITFWPFEQSWVAPRDRSNNAMRYSKVTSVAVLPVEGDTEMRARLAALLQQETALRVEVSMGSSAVVAETVPRSARAVDDKDRSTLAKEITRDLGVDTVLMSRVLPVSPLSSERLGAETEGSRRLYLYLVNHKGHLLWKDELPFTLVPGSPRHWKHPCRSISPIT